MTELDMLLQTTPEALPIALQPQAIRELQDEVMRLRRELEDCQEDLRDHKEERIRLRGGKEIKALTEEVERLKADPLPAAAWVREVERAAFARGAAAMREAAAKECWNASDELADVPDMESEQGTLQNVATRIRALPDPEDK